MSVLIDGLGRLGSCCLFMLGLLSLAEVYCDKLEPIIATNQIVAVEINSLDKVACK